MEEDATLPGTLSGCSGLFPVLPSDLDVISDAAGLGNGVLPNVSEEKVSPSRARNMKDFENQITELKKENFNLKLRIYFLEERMQQEFAGPTEHICKTNIELKVEVESLKRELQERDQLLLKASKAVESLAGGGGSEVQRVEEDARKKVQQVEDLLTKRIHLLEEDVKAAQAELEKAFAGTETEKALRLSLESKLSAMKKMQKGDLEMTLALEEKDRLIEELKLSLKSKEALIQCLKEEKSQMASPDANVSSGELRGLSATLRKEKERDGEAAHRERQKESNHFEERIQALQEDLREKEREIATEKKNSLKRDKAIQGLTMALKSKEKEVEELNSEIRELAAVFTNTRETPSKTQDLRNEVEKLRNEMNEREKAVEKHYESLLGESNRKFHTQEQVVRHPTESTSQEDLTLQKSNEKDLEAIQQNCYLITAEELKFGSNGLITEKYSQQSPGSKLIFSKEKQQSDYEELTGNLKTDRSIYTHLAKTLQDTDSVSELQAELKEVLALRKQLEQDVLAYRNLQKALQEQLCEIRRREEEPFSFYSDQTSYLSICLEEHNQFQVEHFSQEELKKKVSDLIQLVKDLHTDNQHLKKTIFDLSSMCFQGNDRLESTKQAEIMEDYAEDGCKDGYLRHMESHLLDHGAHTPGIPGGQSLQDELQGLLATFSCKRPTPLLESRPDLLKALGALLLERICLEEQGLSGDHLDSKAEKVLQQVTVQLRDELGPSFPANSFSKSHNELKSVWRTGDEGRVGLKNASVQTITIEDTPHGFISLREAWVEKSKEAIFSTEPGSGALGEMPGLRTTPLSFPSAINKDAEKTGLLFQLKTSELLENTYDRPVSLEVVAQLQSQVLELQRELKEFKTRNKQLHDKLILAEAIMEGMAVPNPTLVNDSEICSPDDLALVPAFKENPEDCLDPPSIATYLNSKSQLSVKVSVIGTDPSENIDIPEDIEALKQKIQDLQSELEGYRNFIVQLQKHSQCSKAIITVLCGTEGAKDGLNKSTGHIDEEEMTFSSLHQVRYVKHMKILHSLTPEMIDGRILESLKQQLVEQEQELQKDQDLNLELFSKIHNPQNKFRDLSPSRYDSLVQSQARELSLQRQQIKDSHDICVIYRQHMSIMIKAFEELLQASDVDSCVAEGFREQLTQCAGLLEQLEKLFLHGKSAGVEPCPQSELLQKLRTEEDNFAYQHLLPESPEPSASQSLSDDKMSEKSFLSRDQKPDSETVASHFPQDLLMEHIQEIRTLRKHLEESIKTNEKLRKQLERHGSEADQGSTNVSAYGSELHSSLTSEIHFLRKQNEALSMMLEKGSKDKQKENEKLQECLSRKVAGLEHLQLEYASVREENERLQRDINEKERLNQQLTQEVCSTHQELSRVQEEMKSRQQLLSQKDKLLQSLQVELKVYEKLDEEHGKLQRGARGESSGEGWMGLDPFSNLRSLLTEMQALRKQLEKSIQTNSTLRSKLEEQLSQGSTKAQEGALTLALQALSVTEWSLQLDKHDGNKCPEGSDNSFDLFESTHAMAPKSASETLLLSGTDADSLSCDSSSTMSPTCMPCLVPGHQVWASKSGHHILGLIEDYDALHKQISRGQKLLAKMDIQTQEALSPIRQKLGPKDSHFVPLSTFLSSMNIAKLILEEASRLLKLFWRVSVPTDGQCSLHCEQIEEMKAEITTLHKKLFEQEKKLQNTAKLLQQSKHQEKVIFDQLIITHQVLRKARGNLELRPRAAAHPETSSPSRPGL
ncbi:CDK5 regulatory subunit-associated protein 2 isoform X6 [Psammomys obesus]|uniref:CDK5 regulatory subunit-associated protein 2 isoform X6 n=1 Tax=Psammomys obesus TaxID=48139 RepID=UPI002452B7CA|nr:CDK5 regulatory subunit-associated protein 2 isoform X6 [Psammomys obesus]